MDNGLVQHYRQCHHVHIIVLILIVVEDGLVTSTTSKTATAALA